MAAVYDRLMDHVDFPGITDYYLGAARQFGWTGAQILDLACGTGNITLELLKKGYNVWSLDNSEEMLALADQKIFAAGYQPQLIHQDMKNLQMQESFELVISAFDSLNYLLAEKDVARVFSRVHKVMKPGGLFIFDVHSQYKLKVVFGNRTFTYTGEDYAYIWQNEYRHRTGICNMTLDIFISNENNLYRRIREAHRERYYSPQTLEALLVDKEFKVLGIYGEQKYQKPVPRTERLYFVAQKI